MRRKASVRTPTVFIEPEFREAYHKATHHQRLVMLATQRAVLIRCEEWILGLTKYLDGNNVAAIRQAALRISKVIESTPLDYV